jgi:hypothetical protein
VQIAFFIQTRVAIVGNIGELDRLGAKSIRVSLDEAQKPRELELENSVRKQLIARLGRTRPEFLIEFELAQPHDQLCSRRRWSNV